MNDAAAPSVGGPRTLPSIATAALPLPRLLPPLQLTTLPRPMKAERRHQLQENSLVHALEAAPFFFRRYGTQILLGLLVIILVIVLIRNRAANAQLTEDECRKSLTNARFSIEQLPRAVPMGPNADPK